MSAGGECLDVGKRRYENDSKKNLPVPYISFGTMQSALKNVSVATMMMMNPSSRSTVRLNSNDHPETSRLIYQL